MKKCGLAKIIENLLPVLSPNNYYNGNFCCHKIFTLIFAGSLIAPKIMFIQNIDQIKHTNFGRCQIKALIN